MTGVAVGFTVGSGGGLIAGAAAVTNSSGVATAGSWTLGTTVGTNTLIASTGSLTPVVFTATSTAGAAASVTKVAGGDAQTAQAGTAVAVAPSVTVSDANGNPVAGSSVTFAVTAGGGSVTNGTQTTNASGVATVGSWTLGSTAGANSLSATVGSLAPAVFTATATAGAAASVTKVPAGDNQTAENGTAVPIPPAVTVRDGSGNPASAVTVIFAVGVGGGTVTGSTQVTNTSGVATVGSWTLGAIGTNTLTATAAGLPSVSFTATATQRAACGVRTTHTLGTTTSGTLSTTDCLLSGGYFVDYFTTSVSPAGSFLFNQASTTFDTFLLFYGADGWIIGLNDDEVMGTVQNSRIRALLPVGNYTPGATSFDPGTTGNYTISSTAQASSAVTGCEEIFIAKGVSTDQTLETTDCSVNGLYSDDMAIFLSAGQTVTIEMNSTAFDAVLELYSSSGALVASNDDRDTTTNNARIVYPVTANDFYFIVPTSFTAGNTGPYTLIVQ